MRLKHPFLLCLIVGGLACSFSLFSLEQIANRESIVEENTLELLIRAQEESAQKLKKLLTDLSQFQEQEAKCLHGQANSDDLYRLSELAFIVKQGIADCCVEAYFRPQFLEDINKLSLMAEKKNIPLLTQ